MNWEETFKSVKAWLTTAGIKVLIALILFVVAFKLIDFFSKKIEKKAEKKIEENKNIDKTVYRALSYITKIGLKSSRLRLSDRLSRARYERTHRADRVFRRQHRSCDQRYSCLTSPAAFSC